MLKFVLEVGGERRRALLLEKAQGPVWHGNMWGGLHLQKKIQLGQGARFFIHAHDKCSARENAVLGMAVMVWICGAGRDLVNPCHCLACGTGDVG